MGAFISAAGRALGYSRKAMAEHLGISYAYLGHIESGRRPLPERLESPLDDLLQLAPGRMHDLASAAYVSDLAPDAPEQLTEILQVALSDLDGKVEQWKALELQASTESFMPVEDRTYNALSTAPKARRSVPGERGKANRQELSDHVAALVGSLSVAQLDLVVRLLDVARTQQSETPPST